MSWNVWENSTLARYDREIEQESEYQKWFNRYYDEALELVFESDKSFNDDALKVIREFLNNDYDDLDIMLQDDSIISETALNVINACIRPYMSDYWVDDLHDELEKVIMWHIRLYFENVTTCYKVL